MRTEIIDNCTLIHGDCFGVLSNIRDADCVITDPPYGCSRNNWDNPIDLQLFWKLVNGASKKNAAQCVFCQMPFSADLFQANRQNFRYEYVYVKPKISGFLDANKKPMKAHEQIYVFYRTMPKYEPQKTAGEPYSKGGDNRDTTNYGQFVCQRDKDYDGKRYPTSILKVNHDKCFYIGRKTGFPQHPTQKSVAALSILVKTYTSIGEVILDPFMGSGSTAVAAVRTGRAFIGIEMDERWFDVACKRVEAEYANMALFRKTA